MKSDVRGRLRDSTEQKSAPVQAFEASGLSGPRFAALHGVKYQTMASWIQKRKRAASTGSPGLPCSAFLSLVPPTGITVMPTNLKQIQVNLPPDDFGWFVIPAVENAEPGQLAESKPMLVAGQRQTSKLTVQGCEYRIYSSDGSSAPTEVTRGVALFLRMIANPAAGQTATAEVTIQGVKRTFTVTTKSWEQTARPFPLPGHGQTGKTANRRIWHGGGRPAHQRHGK